MSKPIKYAVAVVLKDSAGTQFLIVKRPDDDPDLRGNWGLPATTLKPGELPEAGAHRVCREKLGCDATVGRFLGVMFQKRNSYDMFLMDIEMTVKQGDRPDVAKATSAQTVYTHQKWATDPLELMPSARHGSCCSTLLLADRGLLDRSQWVDSLEGSDLVQ